MDKCSNCGNKVFERVDSFTNTEIVFQGPIVEDFDTNSYSDKKLDVVAHVGDIDYDIYAIVCDDCGKLEFFAEL